MRILIANLKLFRQCRGLWLFYVLFGLFLGITVYVSLDWPVQAAFIAGPIGAFAAYLQMYVGSRPFALGLPEWHVGMRRFVFVVGVVAGLGTVLVFLIDSDTPAVSGVLFLPASARSLAQV